MSERTKHLSELQDIFNKYIRLRDFGKRCITCPTVLRKDYDCGHGYSVGAYPELRLDEINANGQCKTCNQFKGGLPNNYMVNLVHRHGLTAVEKLKRKRGQPLKLTLPEIKELKKIYRAKIREMEKKMDFC